MTLVDLFLQPSFALTISSFARLALFNVLSFIASACSPASFNIHGHVELHITKGSTKRSPLAVQATFPFVMVVSVRFGSISVSSIWYRPGSVPVRFRFLRFLVDFGSVRFGVWNILH